MSLHLYLSQLAGRRVSKHAFARAKRAGHVVGTKATYFAWLLKKRKESANVTPTAD